MPARFRLTGRHGVPMEMVAMIETGVRACGRVLRDGTVAVPYAVEVVDI